jgi:putative spermidine/putrescine transport system substrate-binding protein
MDPKAEEGMNMSETHSNSPGWSRRAALKLVGAASLAPFAASPALSKPAQLVFASGGGALEEAYRQSVFAAWQKSSGIAITTTSNPAAKLKAMVEQKQVEWDIMQGPAELLVVLARQGLLEPIDYSVVKKDGLVPGGAREHFVLTDFAAYQIAWNTKNLKGSPPRSWNEAFGHTGRIGLWKQPYQTLEVALLADGVAKDKLYPLDVERALQSLARIKDKIAWWSTGAQGAQLILDGEVDICAIWNGRIYGPKMGGAPVDYDFSQAVFVSDAWGVPKGAPNVKESMQLIALEMTAEPQAAFAKAIPYGPTNLAALKLIDAKLMGDLPSSDANFSKGVMLDIDYWADNGAKVVERFNQWLLG